MRKRHRSVTPIDVYRCWTESVSVLQTCGVQRVYTRRDKRRRSVTPTIYIQNKSMCHITETPYALDHDHVRHCHHRHLHQSYTWYRPVARIRLNHHRPHRCRYHHHPLQETNGNTTLCFIYRSDSSLIYHTLLLSYTPTVGVTHL